MSDPTALLNEEEIEMGNKDTTTTAAAAAPVAVPLRLNQLAIVSLICGIVGFSGVGIVFGPIAIVFGLFAYKEMDANPGVYEGRNMAKAGIICGIVVLVVTIIIFIIVVATQA